MTRTPPNSASGSVRIWTETIADEWFISERGDGVLVIENFGFKRSCPDLYLQPNQVFALVKFVTGENLPENEEQTSLGPDCPHMVLWIRCYDYRYREYRFAADYMAEVGIPACYMDKIIEVLRTQSSRYLLSEDK